MSAPVMDRDTVQATRRELLVRLRPIVHATPTARGLHVRGWSSSFTVTGGAGLWRLWQAMSARLADGVPPDQVGVPQSRPEVVRAAQLILDQLHEHDLLVAVPVGWGEEPAPDLPPPDVARWLESVAAEPLAAWERLRAVTVEVSGSGLTAAAAARALTAAGVEVQEMFSGSGENVVLQAGPAVAVAARCQGEVGFTVPVGAADAVIAIADEVAERLGHIDGDIDSDIDSDIGGGESPAPLAALVGGAAAHRLVCAVAGLPDPAEEAAILAEGTTVDGAEPTPDLRYPAVLVARLDPIRATYHPWLPGAGAGSARSAGDIDAVTRRLAVLSDRELGALPEAVPGDLPQVPAMLALAGSSLGVGTTGDAARIDATLRAAEALLPSGTAVGVDVRHAEGVALRRLAHGLAHRLPAIPVTEEAWAGSPIARRWWKALTLRYAVEARLDVRRFTAGRVETDAYHARVLAADGTALGWAVEANAADAAALALLSATGIEQARAAGVEVAYGTVAVTGAAPAWQPDRLDLTPWTDRGWYWPAGVSDSEEALHGDLREILRHEVGPVSIRSLPASTPLLHALSVTGFAVLSYAAGVHDG